MCEVQDGGGLRGGKPRGREGGLTSPLFSLQPLLQLPILGLKLREAGVRLLEAF